MKNFIVFCLHANHTAPNTLSFRGSLRRRCVFPHGHFGLFASRFHNDSNLCGPVLALSAAGQNTQGIGAESIPLSGSRSHSTLSVPFRFMHWVMKVPFFPLLWITYWNPAVEGWFKNSLYISVPLPGGVFIIFLILSGCLLHLSSESQQQTQLENVFLFRPLST